MEEVGQLFKGVLLTAVGLVIIYESYIYNLLDIIMLIGILTLFVGVIMLVMLFLTLDLDKQSKIVKYTKSSLNQKKNNLQNETRTIASLDNSYNNESIFTTINKQFAERFNTPTNNPKAVLRTNSKNIWDESLFDFENKEHKIESAKNISLSPSKDVPNRENSHKIGIMPNEMEKHTQARQFNFTPNYEKPMRVTRKPKKRDVPLNYVKTPEMHEKMPETITPIYAEQRENNLVNNEKESLFKEPSVISNVNNKKIVDDSNNIIPKSTRSTALTEFTKTNVTERKQSQNIPLKTVKNNVLENNQESKDTRLKKSYVICNQGIMTSQEAFEQIAKHAKEDILLEAPSIKDLGNDFLADICKLNSKVIIQEFNIKDTSYILLLTSLIEHGVKVKILPLVNTFNLISDHSYALIISDGQDQTDFDYGAVYTDSNSIYEVKTVFEKSWNLAHSIDKNLNLVN